MPSVSVQHIGHWPWKDETGTGPIIKDNFGYFGDGRGCVIDEDAIPYIQASFPLAYDRKEDAMWHFWRVREWKLSLETVSGYLDGDQYLLIQNVGFENHLITQHNGIRYQVRRVIDDLHYEADIYVGALDAVDDVQVYYNPITRKWLPKIRIQINYFKTLAPEEEILIGTFGAPFPYVALLNGEEVNLNGSGDVVSITFTPSEYWSYGGAYDITTGEPL